MKHWCNQSNFLAENICQVWCNNQTNITKIKSQSHFEIRSWSAGDRHGDSLCQIGFSITRCTWAFNGLTRMLLGVDSLNYNILILIIFHRLCQIGMLVLSMALTWSTIITYCVPMNGVKKKKKKIEQRGFRLVLWVSLTSLTYLPIIKSRDTKANKCIISLS